jgi:hypothetical protein
MWSIKHKQKEGEKKNVAWNKNTQRVKKEESKAIRELFSVTKMAYHYRGGSPYHIYIMYIKSRRLQ